MKFNRNIITILFCALIFNINAQTVKFGLRDDGNTNQLTMFVRPDFTQNGVVSNSMTIIMLTEEGVTEISSLSNIVGAYSISFDINLGAFGFDASLHLWTIEMSNPFSGNFAADTDFDLFQVNVNNLNGIVKLWNPDDTDDPNLSLLGLEQFLSGDIDPNDPSDFIPLYDCIVDDSYGNLILPIELLSFNANLLGSNQTLVEWATAAEINNELFEVEHSLDGANFRKVGTVSGAGNSSIVLDYEFVHDKPARGINYYRLKQVDFDGSSSFSDIKSVQINNVFDVAVYPNPFVNTLTIDHNSAEGEIILMDANGKLVRNESLELGSHNMDVTDLPSGMYYIKVMSGTEYSIEQIIKD